MVFGLYWNRCVGCRGTDGVWRVVLSGVDGVCSGLTFSLVVVAAVVVAVDGSCWFLILLLLRTLLHVLRDISVVNIHTISRK